MTPAGEGYSDVPGGRVWSRIIGSGSDVPLILVPGGPGLGHDYLMPLEALADERPVVLYDQLGSGRSDKPSDESLWELDRFVRELEQLRLYLGIKRFDLLGHSFGGWLAIEYTLAHPRAVRSLILSSTSASVSEYVAGLGSLKSDLPAEDIEALDEHAKRGAYTSEAYVEVLMRFFARHVCRLDPWPDQLVHSFNSYQNSPAPVRMLGPDYFAPDGNLLDWNRGSELSRIEAPALVLCGRHDSVIPRCSETLSCSIANAGIHVFDDASHVAHWETPDAYNDEVRAFLGQLER